MAGALSMGPACVSTGSKDLPTIKAPEKGPLADGETLRIGVIGTGGMGGGHIGGMLRSAKDGRSNSRIVALSDVCKPRLDKNLEKVRAGQTDVEVTGYRDYTELLAREDIHCVLIASPEHWHAKHAMDAITAGKDVYVEKPMTLRLDESVWMHESMLANPHMIAQVGTQYMMLSKYEQARKVIAEGGIGHPTFSQTSYCRNSRDGEWLYGIDEKVQPGEQLDWERWCGPLGVQEWDTEVYHRWRRYRTFSTGVIGDLLVHMMTPMMYALQAGWPMRVTASGGHFLDKAMENHDQVNLTVGFEKEHTMIVAGSTCNEQGLETMIRGHEANIYLGSDDCVVRPERLFVDDIDERQLQGSSGDVQDQLRLDWMNSVRTRNPNKSPVSMAMQVMVVVDLATRSMWDGKAYTFDPETMTASPA
ncbi:MAG: putative dehydrogenase [Planctomycetota bacterium]|jgi:predicted dehydrogenase